MVLADEPERLAPPPFWRTRYFAFDVTPRRPELDPMEIRRIIDRPVRRAIQGIPVTVYELPGNLKRVVPSDCEDTNR